MAKNVIEDILKSIFTALNQAYRPASQAQVIPTPKPLTTDQAIAQMQDKGWRVATPSAIPTATPIPSTNPLDGSFSPERIKAGILRWSKGKTDVPVLNNLDDLYQTGLKFQQGGLDPYMPTILTLRETQGGRDNNVNPNKYGTFNYTNIRNIRDSKTGAIIGQPDNPKSFINYPSVSVGLMGDNGQKGLYGQVFNSGLYNKYLQSKKLEDFFDVYSNPTDKNGPLPEQVQNYNWFRQQF